MSVPYLYNVNTPVKVFLEYGLPLLVMYLGLFFRGQRGAVQGALFVPLMLQFLFTGGYQQFPPVLFVVLLFVAIARTFPAGTLPSETSARTAAETPWRSPGLPRTRSSRLPDAARRRLGGAIADGPGRGAVPGGHGGRAAGG
jgi:hypothetical protein